MMTHDKMIEVIAGHKDHKTIQWKSVGSGWIDSDYIKDVKAIGVLIGNDYELRVKPAPAQRLIRLEELPMPCFVGLPDDSPFKTPPGYNLVLSVDRAKRSLAFAWSDSSEVMNYSIEALGEMKAIWTADGKSWHSFMVDEKEGE